MICPMCNGSGLVAYGPWGVRPPRRRCHVCNGTREVPDDYQEDTVTVSQDVTPEQSINEGDTP